MKIGQLICDDSQSPQVNMSFAGISIDHFRRGVHLSSNTSVVFHSCFYLLRKTEVSQFHIAIVEDKQILRFKIIVDNVPFMQILQSKDDTAQNESDPFLADFFEYSLSLTFGLDQAKHCTSFSPLHCQIVVLFISESIVSSDNKVISGLESESFLYVYIFHQFLMRYLWFFHLFDCKDCCSFLVSLLIQISEVDITKTAVADEIHYIEIFKANAFGLNADGSVYYFDVALFYMFLA